MKKIRPVTPGEMLEEEFLKPLIDIHNLEVSFRK
jgi:plasmid maintenance system antidote protein VapI